MMELVNSSQFQQVRIYIPPDAGTIIILDQVQINELIAHGTVALNYRGSSTVYVSLISCGSNRRWLNSTNSLRYFAGS